MHCLKGRRGTKMVYGEDVETGVWRADVEFDETKYVDWTAPRGPLG